jgi:DNA polymerase III delta subunit
VNDSSNPLPSSVTVFHGDNTFEIRERVFGARQVIDPTGLSTSVFENANTSVPEISTAVSSPGFFGADRLVICHNLASSTPGKRRKKSDQSGENSDPLDIISSVAPGVWLVVIEPALKAAEEKQIRSKSDHVEVVRLTVPRGRSLIDWTCERARAHSAALDGATATRIVEALFPGTWREALRWDDVPPDLYRLDAEIAKLAVAAGTDQDITSVLVEDLVPSEDARDTWGLSNAIADRDQSRAIKQLELAIDSGQPPEAILGQLVAQFETFAVVNASGSRPTGTVASMTGLSEGRLRQAGRSARNFQRSDLVRCILAIRDADFGIKQGLHEPEDALVTLIAQLSQRPVR